MANTRSAEKRNRQALANRARNRSETSKLRTQVKKLRAVITGGDNEAARKELSTTYTVIDKAAKQSVIKKNTASRYKSRLAKAVKKAATA